MRGCLQKCLCYALCCRESLALESLATGKGGERPTRARHGSANGCRRFRELHRDRLMRSRLPETNQPWLHRQNESRLRTGNFERSWLPHSKQSRLISFASLDSKFLVTQFGRNPPLGSAFEVTFHDQVWFINF